MKRCLSGWVALVLGFGGTAGSFAQKMNSSNLNSSSSTSNQLELATFGGGCFWCIEAVFERLDGVKSVTSGYAGGRVANPTYEQVCAGDTGHAEVAQIEFDPKKISYEQLLATFWDAHDPTTLNRQGPDTGTQYRSVIFHHNDAQKTAAEKSKREAQAHFPARIVTEIAPLTKFYKAENFHQDYYRNNARAPYCQFVIRPKLEKLDQKKVAPVKWDPLESTCRHASLSIL